MLFKINTKLVTSKKQFRNQTASIFFIDISEDKKSVVKKLEKQFDLTLNDYQKTLLFDDKKDELTLHKSEGRPDIIFICKTRKNPDLNTNFFRNILAGIIQRLENEEIRELTIFIPEHSKFSDPFTDEVYYLQTFFEGLVLGNYSFNEYKTDKKKFRLLTAEFVYSNGQLLKKASYKSKILMDAVNFARDLVNEPAITLTPLELLKRTKKELSKTGVKVSSFDKIELKRRKMNSILAVGSGSANSPYLIQMEYKPKVKAKKKIALVGKGVTYDSGGLSIKPTAGMLEMNADMAGAATVIGIIKAVSEAKLPIEVIGIVPAVENMVSGSSYKPGDVIRSYSGKTIEVKDTDAEGRIVLADALSFVSKKRPDQIIDFATLTGAAVVALGNFTAALFSKNDEIVNNLILSSEITYEKLWRLPFWDEFKKDLKSDIADISNLGPRWGSSITAGKFLEFFVEPEIPYVHIDLAGPALKHDYFHYTKKYSTGFGIRVIFDYLEKLVK